MIFEYYIKRLFVASNRYFQLSDFFGHLKLTVLLTSSSQNIVVWPSNLYCPSLTALRQTMNLSQKPRFFMWRGFCQHHTCRILDFFIFIRGFFLVVSIVTVINIKFYLYCLIRAVTIP